MSFRGLDYPIAFTDFNVNLTRPADIEFCYLGRTGPLNADRHVGRLKFSSGAFERFQEGLNPWLRPDQAVLFNLSALNKFPVTMT